VIRHRAGALSAAVLVLLVATLAGRAAPARAAEYALESTATYEVLPAQGEIGVHVELTFTNTTPDPSGQFSVFDELRLAIHDHAGEIEAADGDGELEVRVAEDDGVNVATITLREGLRFEDSVEIAMDYVLSDGAGPELRIGPSLVVFPAWGFGTASEVTVDLPAGFEVRVDGDALREDGGVLTSGPIDDPAAWLTIVTATGPADFQSFEATVPLGGGTADLLVRSFADDPEWGSRTRDLLVEALPLIEREVGLPYPLLGQLIITQGVPADSSSFGETVTRRMEVVVGYDQPPFTVLHQVAHLWLPPSLVAARWIQEGMASDVAARVAAELGVALPYDPAAVGEEHADAAFPLDSWTTAAVAEADTYGYAASWALAAELRTAVGDDAMRTVFARTAASIGPYDGTSVEPPAVVGNAPLSPLTTRSFLDQLETVGSVDLGDRFAARALGEADAAVLPLRSDARAAFDALGAAAGGWGAPDPVRAALSDWDFDEGARQIDAARAWLERRDGLLADMERVGLSSPDRLQQAYRAYGGGPEAVTELEAQRGVVDAYAAAAERINAPRSFMARLGLLGGADPAVQLARANGLFADGSLPDALAAIGEAERLLSAAETAGIVRLASLLLLVVILAGLAIALFRRRASYTAAP
jgi:hypothetical protein